MTPARFRRIAALCTLPAALALSACGGSSDANNPRPTVDQRSSLAFGPCVVTIADPTAVCGSLTVPEDRADRTSRLIALPFVILTAKAVPKAADPVALFTGGPGISSLRVVAAIAAPDLDQFALRQRRDVIVMTQRGTDLTAPQSLDCPELVLDFAAGERFASEDAVIAAATACRDRLADAGVKSSAYTTKAIARDMEDLRVLLGAERGFGAWNIVGSSYGSKLAQAYVRDMPQGVRSVVYDGPSPLADRDLYYAGQLDALSHVIEACFAQPDCSAAFPDLRTRFAAALERLQATPQLIRGVRVRGHEVLNAVRATLAVPLAEYGKLPLFMDRVARGDLEGADTLLPFVDSLLLAINPEGMFYTVTCSDDAGLSSASSNELPSGGAGWPDAVRLLIARNGLGLQARTCPLWTRGQTLSTDGLQPLRSDIPALITVGQFDGATPAALADVLQAGLSRAYKVVFTGRGHGLLESDPCMLQVTVQFLDAPNRSPDTSCVDAPESLRFVTPASVGARNAALQDTIGAYLRAQPLVPSVIAQLDSPADALAWSGARGLVERTRGDEVTPRTAFRIASVTKTFTSAAIHRLAEEGLLQLDDPIARHLLPGTMAVLRERGYAPDQITVLHLLAHTSGLPNHDSPAYQEAVLADLGRRWTRLEQLRFGLDRFAGVGAPGQTFEYSDTGYILLGEIIENKTSTNLGTAYRSLLRFDALGMASTWMEAFEPAPLLPDGVAHAYADNGFDLRAVDATVDTYGGGGLVSTVGDLARFFRALLEGRVLSPASLASMQTQSIAPDSRLGRGIFLLPVGTQDCWAHEGFWGGGAYYCPASRISVALTINLALFDETRRSDDALAPSTLAGVLIERALRGSVGPAGL